MLVRKIIFSTLAVLLGLVFIISGFTKLHPVELFEYSFIDIGVAGWKSATFHARFIIGMEFFVGLLLVLNFRLQRLTLRLATGILIFFTIFLILQIIFEGNSGNCKCFGNIIYMTPLQSVWKNLIMIAVAILISRYHNGFRYPVQKVILIAAIAISFSLPFILNPINFSVSSAIQTDAIGYELDLDVLYEPTKTDRPIIELRKGKHILVFISLTCSHCKVAAYKLHILKKRNPDLPIFLILNGDEEDLDAFFEETKVNNNPYTILLGQDFIRLGGVRLPSILWVENSRVVNKTGYLHLHERDIVLWLNEE